MAFSSPCDWCNRHLQICLSLSPSTAMTRRFWLESMISLSFSLFSQEPEGKDCAITILAENSFSLQVSWFANPSFLHDSHALFSGRLQAVFSRFCNPPLKVKILQIRKEMKWEWGETGRRIDRPHKCLCYFSVSFFFLLSATTLLSSLLYSFAYNSHSWPKAVRVCPSGTVQLTLFRSPSPAFHPDPAWYTEMSLRRKRGYKFAIEKK